MNQDERLDQLFAQARAERPEATFEETKNRFLSALVLAAGGVLATKGLLQLLTTKKWIIMISSVSVITGGAIVASSMISSSETENLVENSFSEGNHGPVATAVDVLEVTETRKEEENETFFYQPVQESSEVGALQKSDIEAIHWQPLFAPIDGLVRHDDTLKKIERITPYAERFSITRNSSEQDFVAMKEAAEQAGIDFSYNVNIKNDQLKSFDVTMILVSRDGIGNKSKHQSHTSVDFDKEDAEDEAYIIGWKTNDKGKAIGLGVDDENKCGEGGVHVHPHDCEIPDAEGMIWVPDSFTFDLSDSFNFDFDFEGMDIHWSEGGTYAVVFDMEELKASMKELELEMKELNIQIQEELRQMMIELNEELKEVQEDLEEEIEEQKRQLEEEEREREKRDRDREKKKE